MSHEHRMEQLRAAIRLPGNSQKSYKFFCRGLDIRVSKVVTVIIGIVVICFGVFQPGSIFEINLFAFSGMAIFVVPILFGIYWKKATAKGAIASVIVGIISLLLFTLNPSVKALAMGFHALFPTTIIASIVMIVVSKFTETPPQETIDRHFTV